MKTTYQVIVSNIGTVYNDICGITAINTYNEYVLMSKNNYGRIAGENVCLMIDNDFIKFEYFGKER